MVTKQDALATRKIINEIIDERERQIFEEGWTPAHDDTHDRGEMAQAAECYAAAAAILAKTPSALIQRPSARWPWSAVWWKPGAPRRMLIKAAALIVAEIERLDRAEARKKD